jgi:hypothetical protein
MLKQRDIREEAAYRVQLLRLIPDAQEADDVLEAATEFFRLLADEGELIPETAIRVKIFPDPKRRRYLVIFYTIEGNYVCPRSIRHFPFASQS